MVEHSTLRLAISDVLWRILGGGFKRPCQENREASQGMQIDHPPLVKVLIIGTSEVGKTSLVNRLVFHDFLDVSPTIGVNFAQKVCVGERGPLNLSIWDLSGQERFRFIMPQLCSGAVGVLLVFDQSQPATLEAAAEWLDFVGRYANPSHRHAVVLVGAKADLEPALKPAIIREFCVAHDVTAYVQCSAKTGSNVKLAFDTAASAIQRGCPALASDANLAGSQRNVANTTTACETPTSSC
jgi:small GTP-binding protein